MISLADAFGSETTFNALLFVAIPGHWDENNDWVPDTYAPGFKFPVTGVPDSASRGDTKGEEIKADPYGERHPATMKFRSRFEMPLNSYIEVDGVLYRVTQRGNYSPAKHWAAMGYKDTSLNASIQTIAYADVPEDIAIRMGNRAVNLKILLRNQGHA